jgi:hypothetical protein
MPEVGGQDCAVRHNPLFYEVVNPENHVNPV